MSGLAYWGGMILAELASAAELACFILGFLWLLALTTGLDALGLRGDADVNARVWVERYGWGAARTAIVGGLGDPGTISSAAEPGG